MAVAFSLLIVGLNIKTSRNFRAVFIGTRISYYKLLNKFTSLTIAHAPTGNDAPVEKENCKCSSANSS